jgi:hypothetical protein
MKRESESETNKNDRESETESGGRGGIEGMGTREI